MKKQNLQVNTSNLIAAIIALLLVVLMILDIVALVGLSKSKENTNDTVTVSEADPDIQGENEFSDIAQATAAGEENVSEDTTLNLSSETGSDIIGSVDSNENDNNDYNVDANSSEASLPENIDEPTEEASVNEILEESEDPVDQPGQIYDGSIDNIIASMTLEQKVYQMFIVTPEDLVDSYYQDIKDAVDAKPVGGVIYFANNFIDPQQTISMTSDIMQCSYGSGANIGMFLAVDEEGGIVSRIAKNPSFGIANNKAMEYIYSDGEAFEVGCDIASYLEKYGLNLDFAPVADVNIDPNNELIVDHRIFSDDAAEVSSRVNSIVRGLQSTGKVCATLKHFPGLGAEDGNTHTDAYTRIDRTMEQLRSEEFVAFQGGIDAGADFVMVGHQIVSAAGDYYTPSDMSSVVVTDWLRGELGYNGIVITDSQKMGTITNVYGPADAAIQSIKAGVDIILMPNDLEEAKNGVINAINAGIISEERIDESLRRILAKKDKLGLLNNIQR